MLLASVDKDNSGDLGLDEFMDLIFNDQDILKVDLSKMYPLSDKEKEVLLSHQSENLIEHLKKNLA